MKPDTYIPLDQCKHGFLYRLSSRNLAYGVFNKDTKGFTGLRTKFSSVFLFEEYHWDTGEPYGTACPLEEIEDYNLVMHDTTALQLFLHKLEYLKQKEEVRDLGMQLYLLKQKNKRP
jgi:hypothetical protein